VNQWFTFLSKCCKEKVQETLFDGMHTLRQSTPPKSFDYTPSQKWYQRNYMHYLTMNIPNYKEFYKHRKDDFKNTFEYEKRLITDWASGDWCPDLDYCRFKFSSPPGGYDSMARLTVRTIVKAWLKMNKKPLRDKLIRESLFFQTQQDTNAVIALLIYLHLENDSIIAFFEETKLHCYPMERWPDLKSNFDTIRQTGWLTPNIYDCKAAMLTRKIVCLIGRDTAEADWKQQSLQRTSPGPLRKTDMNLAKSKSQKVKFEVIDEIATRVITSLKTGPGQTTLLKYFSERLEHAPGGSSDIDKDKVKEYFNLQKSRQIQITKQVAYEIYDYPDLIEWLLTAPRIIARGSTKHEPGKKNRDLEATDDISSFMASYASDGIENRFHWRGTVISQTPAEILQWWYQQVAGYRWWVSYDYTSYNLYNNVEDMVYLNIALAEKWLTLHEQTGEPSYLDKAYAALWTAESHYAAVLKTPIGDIRNLRGLFSGSRDTMRDNTLLHVYYNELAFIMYKKITGQARDHTTMLKSGDDEVGGFHNQLDCYVYVRSLEHAGLVGKRSKLLIAERTSEFLQLMVDEEGSMTYPIASAIATFVSGNWYKEPVRRIEEYFKSLTDQVWNFGREGVNVDLCRYLVEETMDWFCRVPITFRKGTNLILDNTQIQELMNTFPDTVEKKVRREKCLETKMFRIDWRKYALSCYSNVSNTELVPLHPMWKDSPFGIQPWPKVEHLQIQAPRIGRATNDIVTKNHELWEAADHENVEVFKDLRTMESIRSLFRQDLDNHVCRQYYEKVDLISEKKKYPMLPKIGHFTLKQDSNKIMAMVNKSTKMSKIVLMEDLLMQKRIPLMLAQRINVDKLPYSNKLRSLIQAYQDGVKKIRHIHSTKTDHSLPPVLADH